MCGRSAPGHSGAATPEPILSTTEPSIFWPSAAAALPRPWAFALLYAIESFSRATLVSTVPIQAYDLLQNKQHVSMLYFVVGVVGMGATLCAPLLFSVLRRRTVYVIGAGCIIASGIGFATFTLPGQAAGMFLRIAGSGTLSIALSLYLLDHVGKQGLVRAESLRLAMATFAWTVCPLFGVWLYVHFGHVAPNLWSGFWAVLLIGAFFAFRLTAKPGDGPGSRQGRARPANPFAGIRRFVGQPRMRLAWLIAFGRSCYWGTFYVYAPILLVATGQGKLAAGLIVSLGNALLALAIWWGRLGDRFGVRRVVVCAFAGLAAMAIAAGIAGERHPWLAAVLLLTGVNCAVALDSVGGAPFFRAVHPYERPQMTAVYRTNLDLSDLLPALIYSVILGFAGLGAVFATLGVFCAVCGGLAWRHLPRSM